MSKRSRLALTLSCAALLGSCAVAEGPHKEPAPKRPPVVVESDHVSYGFTLPEGWDSSTEEGPLFGVRVMIFEKGSDFHEGTSVMYVTEPCTASCAGKLDEEIDRVLARARTESPELVVSRAEPLSTKSGRAEVRILTGATDPRQAKEALAFVERPEVLLLVVLSTRDPSRWDRDYRAFGDLLAGLEFLPAPSSP